MENKPNYNTLTKGQLVEALLKTHLKVKQLEDRIRALEIYIKMDTTKFK